MTHPPVTPDEQRVVAAVNRSSSWNGKRVAALAVGLAVATSLVAALVAYEVSSSNRSEATALAQSAGTAQQAQGFAEEVKAACARDSAGASAAGFPCNLASSIAAGTNGSPASSFTYVGQTGSQTCNRTGGTDLAPSYTCAPTPVTTTAPNETP